MISKRLFVPVSLFVICSAWMISGQENEYFARANQALLGHRFDDAITDYLKAITYSNYREARLIWDDLGYAYLEKRNYSKALDYLEMSAPAFPEDFDVRFYIAVAFFLSHQTDESAARLDEIARNIYFDGRWLEDSMGLNILNEFGDLVPRQSLERLRKEKGVYLLRKGPGTAVLFIDAFNEKNEGLFHYLKGLILDEKGLTKEAQRQFAAAAAAGYEMNERPRAKEGMAVEIEHRLKGHAGSLAWLVHERVLKELGRSDIPNAIHNLEDALHIDQKSFEINHNLALLQYDMGDLEQAEIFCARALWWLEDDAPCHELMGNIYFRGRAYEKALKEFERAVELDAKSASAYHNLGSAYYALNDTGRAELYWKKVIECEREKGIINPEISSLKTGSSELKHSLTIKERPVSFLSYTSLGRLYLEQKLLDSAVEQFRKAMEIAPRDAEIYLDMAKALMEKGLKEEAAGYLDKYFILGGKNEGEARELSNKLKKRSYDENAPATRLVREGQQPQTSSCLSFST